MKRNFAITLLACCLPGMLLAAPASSDQAPAATQAVAITQGAGLSEIPVIGNIRVPASPASDPQNLSRMVGSLNNSTACAGASVAQYFGISVDAWSVDNMLPQGDPINGVLLDGGYGSSIHALVPGLTKLGLQTVGPASLSLDQAQAFMASGGIVVYQAAPTVKKYTKITSAVWKQTMGSAYTTAVLNHTAWVVTAITGDSVTVMDPNANGGAGAKVSMTRRQFDLGVRMLPMDHLAIGILPPSRN